MSSAPISMPPVSIWSSKLAFGDAGFVEQIKKNVGSWVYPVKCTKCPAEQDSLGYQRWQ